MGMSAHVHKNFEDWPCVKIGPHENFPLYSILQPQLLLGCGTHINSVNDKIKCDPMDLTPIRGKIEYSDLLRVALRLD